MLPVERSGIGPPTAGEYQPPSLHEVVERIERRRRLRAEQSTGPDHIQPPGTDRPSLFRWESSSGGELVWVDGVPRGALIGRSIARAQDHGRLDPNVIRAFAVRAPFRDAMFTVAGSGPAAGRGAQGR